MSDKSLGSLIFIMGLIGAIAYTYWLFWPADPQDIVFYCPIEGVGRWAIVIPLFITIVGILLIAMWMGWTMVATSPPTSSEEEKEG